MRRFITALSVVAVAGFSANWSLAQDRNAAVADDANRGKVDAARVQHLETAIEKLLSENDDLKEQVRILNEAIRQLATQYGTEKWTPKVFANMDANDDFRREVMRTNQGRLVLNNMMRRSVTYYINGARWRIPPGPHNTIPVPLGKLTVHTVGEIATTYEEDDWKLSTDRKHYEIRLSIRPKNSIPRGF